MLEIMLEPAADADLETWDTVVAAAAGATPFHRIDCLRAMAEESRTELIPLVARAGQERVAVLPVFLKRRVGLRALVSPPPGCAVPSLGPVICSPQGGPRRTEGVLSALADALTNFLAEERIDFAGISLHQSVQDVRPFLWRGFTAHPCFDYVVPITGTDEDVFSRCESRTRTTIRRARRNEKLRVGDGTIDEALLILELLRKRYAQQGKRWSVSPRYLRAVFAAVPAEQIGVKLALVEDRILTGMITLYYADTAQDWIGGFSPVEPVSGANELLHWSIIEEARRRGAVTYDLGGANTPHLARSKAKYGPELRPNYRVERAGAFARAVKEVVTSPLGRTIYAQLQ